MTQPQRAILAAAAALTIATSSTAQASGPLSSPVIRDCAHHPHGLLHRYSLAQLRGSLRGLPPDVADYTACKAEIKSQIAGYVGRRGEQEVKAVIADCEKHGELTLRYSTRTLRSALVRLPPDAADYGTCAQAITSQSRVGAR